MSNTLVRNASRGMEEQYYNIYARFIDQRLDLCKANADDTEPVKGQIVVSLLSREMGNGSSSNVGHTAVADPLGDISCPDLLPEGWEERRTSAGRLYYVNHHTKTTQWFRPNRYKRGLKKLSPFYEYIIRI